MSVNEKIANLNVLIVRLATTYSIFDYGRFSVCRLGTSRTGADPIC